MVPIKFNFLGKTWKDCSCASVSFPIYYVVYFLLYRQVSHLGRPEQPSSIPAPSCIFHRTVRLKPGAFHVPRPMPQRPDTMCPKRPPSVIEAPISAAIAVCAMPQQSAEKFARKKGAHEILVRRAEREQIWPSSPTTARNGEQKMR